LTWGPSDASLVSAGSDGALFCWDWENGKRLGESVTKGLSYASCVVAQVTSATCLVVGWKSYKRLFIAIPSLFLAFPPPRGLRGEPKCLRAFF